MPCCRHGLVDAFAIRDIAIKQRCTAMVMIVVSLPATGLEAFRGSIFKGATIFPNNVLRDTSRLFNSFPFVSKSSQQPRKYSYNSGDRELTSSSTKDRLPIMELPSSTGCGTDSRDIKDLFSGRPRDRASATLLM
jgi:hypothetical protein